MSFPKYPTYKSSGVEWLGDVPEHWVSAKFARVILAIKDGTHGTFERLGDGEPLLSAKNVANGFLDIADNESLISQADHDSIVSNGFPSRGDLLLTIVGTIGRACVYNLDKPMAFQRSVCFLRFTDRNSSRYFYYFSQSKFFQEQLVGRSKSSAQAGVYMGDVAATSVVFPSDLEEQIQIARFLDHETTKIDVLIQEQERLIDLLKEKRQAVISHAVTKGLDPSAPMKGSGVEWLGEVPEHWQVVRIKNVAKLESGHTPSKDFPEYWDDEGIPWVSLNDTKQLKKVDYIGDTQYKITQLGLENSSARLLPARSVVFTRDATIGLTAITTREMAVSQHLIAWVCNVEIILPEFLLLVSYAMEYELNRFTFGATIKTIGLADVKCLKTTLPSICEQRLIVDKVGKVRAKLDALVENAERASKLLIERRAALISAAVTGKIDVRGWRPDKSLRHEQNEKLKPCMENA